MKQGDRNENINPTFVLTNKAQHKRHITVFTKKIKVPSMWNLYAMRV